MTGQTRSPLVERSILRVNYLAYKQNTEILAKLKPGSLSLDPNLLSIKPSVAIKGKLSQYLMEKY